MQQDPLIGTRLGSYHIQSKLGEGGMAWVYKGFHMTLQRGAAIKVILPQKANLADFKVRFVNEAQLSAKLQHPNIVAVYDAGEDRQLMFLAMQYVSGGTLRDLLLHKRILDPRQAALYALQMTRALRHAHQHNIVHRDVKPANMLFATPGSNELLLSDFGIARLFEQQIEGPLPTVMGSKEVLAHTHIAGTPLYMAPEQIKGHALDARTDVYALGIVLYEMLTGQPPFQADNMYALHYQQVYATPRSVRELNPAVHPTLEQITMRAIAKAPDERYQSADEMGQALKRFLVPTMSIQTAEMQAVSVPASHNGLLRPRNIALVFFLLLVILQVLNQLGVFHH